jgi:hypothetical protein
MVSMGPTVENDGLKLKLWIWKKYKWYRNSVEILLKIQIEIWPIYDDEFLEVLKRLKVYCIVGQEGQSQVLR